MVALILTGLKGSSLPGLRPRLHGPFNANVALTTSIETHTTHDVRRHRGDAPPRGSRPRGLFGTRLFWVWTGTGNDTGDVPRVTRKWSTIRLPLSLHGLDVLIEHGPHGLLLSKTPIVFLCGTMTHVTVIRGPQWPPSSLPTPLVLLLLLTLPTLKGGSSAFTSLSPFVCPYHPKYTSPRLDNNLRSRVFCYRFFSSVKLVIFRSGDLRNQRTSV